MTVRSAPFTLLLLLSICGCATAPPQKEESHPPFWPNGERWKEAAGNALRSPVTWGPAAGATVVAAGGWDKKISDWAVENTPVFGSVKNAQNASDDLRSLSGLGMLGTAVAVPGGNHPVWPVVKRLLIEEAGVILASSTTTLIKRAIQRERPDESDNHSFPSGHSTRAFAYTAMSSRNLDSIEMPDPARDSLKALFLTIAAGTAWARVEGGRHYPSDVLAGAAVGNFVSILTHDAFLGRQEKVSWSLQAAPEGHGVSLTLELP